MRISAESISVLGGNGSVAKAHDIANLNRAWLADSAYANDYRRYGLSVSRAALECLVRQPQRGSYRHYLLRAEGVGHSYGVGMATIVRNRRVEYERLGDARDVWGTYVDYWLSKQWQKNESAHRAAAVAVIAQVNNLNRRQAIARLPDTVFTIIGADQQHCPAGFTESADDYRFDPCGIVTGPSLQRPAFSCSPDPYNITKAATPDNPSFMYSFAPASEYPSY